MPVDVSSALNGIEMPFFIRRTVYAIIKGNQIPISSKKIYYKGSIQGMDNNDIQNAGWGNILLDTRKIYTRRPLKESDIVLWDDKVYTLKLATPWKHYGYYLVYAIQTLKKLGDAAS